MLGLIRFGHASRRGGLLESVASAPSGVVPPGGAAAVAASCGGSAGGSDAASPRRAAVARKPTAVPAELLQLLESRPNGLPPKDPAEMEQHLRQYEAMMQQKRKREAREARLQADEMERRAREMDEMTARWSELLAALPAVRGWPPLHASVLHARLPARRVRELCWRGLPGPLRSTLWPLFTGNDLRITADLFDILRQQARARILANGLLCSCCGDATRPGAHGTGSPRASRALAAAAGASTGGGHEPSGLHVVHLDAARTFPQLRVFQATGPMHEPLCAVLEAFACYRPDIGYVQGMSYVASMLLLNMPLAEAFSCLCNIVCSPLLMAFYRMDLQQARGCAVPRRVPPLRSHARPAQMTPYLAVYEMLMEETVPKLSRHFRDHRITPNLYIIDWYARRWRVPPRHGRGSSDSGGGASARLLTIYSRALPLDVATRLWDVFLLHGDVFLLQAALGTYATRAGRSDRRWG